MPCDLPAIFKNRQEHSVSCPPFRTGVINTQQLPQNSLDPQDVGEHPPSSARTNPNPQPC